MSKRLGRQQTAASTGAGNAIAIWQDLVDDHGLSARYASVRWGKLLDDTVAVTALLDRLLHHAHVLECGPRSWRTRVQTDLRTEEATK